MSELKKIVLSDGSVISTKLDKDVYCGHFFSINKRYIINGKLDKSIKLSMWDDFSFEGYSYDKYNREVEDINFEFDVNDPLYFSLNRLLMYKNPLVIDDDETYGIMRKYMEIKKDNGIITIKMSNKTVNDKDYDFYHKWYIFIKNIGSDSRSKIEDDNIKYNLINFFRESEELLLSNYHQITMDEYLEIKKHDEKILRK